MEMRRSNILPYKLAPRSPALLLFPSTSLSIGFFAQFSHVNMRERSILDQDLLPKVALHWYSAVATEIDRLVYIVDTDWQNELKALACSVTNVQHRTPLYWTTRKILLANPYFSVKIQLLTRMMEYELCILRGLIESCFLS